MAASPSASRFAIDLGGKDAAPGEATSRRRVTWTKDEKLKLHRLSKIFVDHGDSLQMRCGNTTCPDREIHIHVAPSEPTGAVLRCGCTDRIFTNAA